MSSSVEKPGKLLGGLMSYELLDQALIYMSFALYGICGVLIRQGLDKLTVFPGSQYGGVLWANFGGSLFMGFLIHDKVWTAAIMDIANQAHRRKNRSYKTKGQIPLYILMTTGVCGSVTSFSSFMTELFFLTSNTATLGPNHVDYPNPAYGIMVFLSYLIITMCVSCGGFFVGKHIADDLANRLSVEKQRWFSKYEFVFELVSAVLGVCAWIIMLVLTIVKPNWRYWTFSCVFGPLGVFFRFWCSKYLNPISKTFFWGTFAANISGTILINMFCILELGKKPGTDIAIIRSSLQNSVLLALENGLCGNFTTISSFISELTGLKTRNAYIYGGSTVIIAWCITVLMLGSYTWTHGLL